MPPATAEKGFKFPKQVRQNVRIASSFSSPYKSLLCGDKAACTARQAAEKWLGVGGARSWLPGRALDSALKAANATWS